MKVVRDGSGQILPLQEEQINIEYVYHPYLIYESGYIYNAFTGEIIKDVNETADRHELIQRWYLVPKDQNLESLLYLFRQNQLIKYNPTSINKYTIFTTMNCNAKCEYCFQHGGNNTQMTWEVARDTANYIMSHANPKEYVEIGWFGGEPLVNKNAINYISNRLRNNNFPLRSSLSSNGDLFNLVTDAEIYLWNLKKVQLTVDIPGEEYSKVKGLPEGAYERLKASVQRMFDLGIRAQIRVHYHPEYGLDVAKSIVDDFKTYSNVMMYPAMLYDNESETKHTLEDYMNLADLESYMVSSGVLSFNPATIGRPTNCMADDAGIRCIRVDGSFTACEHFYEGEQYGTINADDYDWTLHKKWSAKRKFTNKCYDCPLFPVCEIIDNCPSVGRCEDGYKVFRIEQIRRALKQMGESNE